MTTEEAEAGPSGEQAPSPASSVSELREISDNDSGASDEYIDDGAVNADDMVLDDVMDIDVGPPPARDGRKGPGRPRGSGKRGRGSTRPLPRKIPRVSVTPKLPPTPSVAGQFDTVGTGADDGMPPAYRDYLMASSVIMVKGPDWRPHTYQTTGGSRVPIFPIGPVTPFVSRLTAPPFLPGDPGRPAAYKVVPDPLDTEERVARRRETCKLHAREFALVEPWQIWEGEGWWPEMVRGAEEAQDGPIPHWRWRDQIRIGVDDVGRDWTDRILPPSDAQQFLQPERVILSYGAHNALKRVEMNPFDAVPSRASKSYRLLTPENVSEVSHGFIFNAGAPVWGLDWCPCPERLTEQRDWVQYVAVSTVSMDVPIGGRCPPDTPGAIQVWSVPTAGPGTPRCEIVLCLQGGPAMEVRWMPIGAWDERHGANPKLGVIAAVQVDGTVSFYAVPDPRSLAQPSTQTPIYLRPRRLLTLGVDDAVVTCIDWLGATRLVAGLSNGCIAVWDIDLVSGETPLPSMYTTVALAPVRSVAAGRVPPLTSVGECDFFGDAVYVVVGSWEGCLALVDLREPTGSLVINRSRLPTMSVAWSSQASTPLYADVDYMVTAAQLRSEGPSTHVIAPHRGPIWSIATSDYHHMIASAGSDGAMLLSSFATGFFRRKQAGLLYLRLYELDYDETTNEYRMVDDFMPEACGVEDAIRHLGKKRASGKDPHTWAPTEGDSTIVKTGAWSRNVGIHRAAWLTGGGIGSAGWLASGGYSGLVRVEAISGKVLGE